LTQKVLQIEAIGHFFMDKERQLVFMDFTADKR